ncbi:Ig-like domain-containing protein [Acinetobacter gerneri]|uniref:Ig-like domain-containing protein n=1 Tax=Acinetobacter gerneri TaxID=202952 RepID=UPI003A850959
MVAPDTTAPSSLTQALSADNQTITGTTEAGAIVKVSLKEQVIGSATANADGTYKVVLDKAYNNGEVFNITASDKAGNSTLPNTLVAPDTTALSTLSQTISQDGKLVSGTTEAGATVQVSFNGQVIGSATAGADGKYTISLNKAYRNGEILTVTASDKAGNSTSIR